MNENASKEGNSIIPIAPPRPHAESEIRELLMRCHDSEVLQVINELLENVRTMGIASRFRPDRYVHPLTSDDEAHPPLEHIDRIFGNGEKLSEVGHRRATLMIPLMKMRADIMILFATLAQLRLEIEATNMEEDGSHVPKPSPDELKKNDIYQRP